jgi:hypothetical protein
VGVIDIPHLDDGLTTGDLAEILEGKYDLFRGFVEANLEEIADKMAESLEGSVENILAGGPVAENPYAEAMDWIRARFQKFLDSGESETIGMIGVPTGAALAGVNRRLSARRGPRRESFIDSGLLRATLIAWFEAEGSSFGQSGESVNAQTGEIQKVLKQ